MALGDRRGALEEAVSEEEEETTSPVEETFGGGDLQQSGDPDQQTGSSGRERDRPAERERDRDDQPRQTGPTGPSADEGVENTGSQQPEPSGDTFDPTAESSPGGTGVSQAELQSAIEEGKTITNIEESPAVASQLERLGYGDVREQDIGQATDIDFGKEGFEVRTSERDIAQQLESQITERRENLQPEDVAIVGSMDEGFQATLTQEAQREQRASRIAELADIASQSQQANQFTGATSPDAFSGRRTGGSGTGGINQRISQPNRPPEAVIKEAAQESAQPQQPAPSASDVMGMGTFAGAPSTGIADEVRGRAPDVTFTTGTETTGGVRFGIGERPKGEEITFGEAIEQEFLTPDTDITDRLTSGKGLLSEEREQEALRQAQERREQFSLESQAESFIGQFGVGETATEFAGGVAQFPGEVAALPETLSFGADLATEVGQNLPGAVREEGLKSTTQAIGESFGVAGAGVASQAQENPASFAGQATGEILLGTAALRATERVPNVARAGTIRARGGRIYNLETDFPEPVTRTEGSGLPGYSPAAQADPDVARREFTELAEQTPVGEGPTAFSVRGAPARREFGTFGPEFEAPAGSSELPGQFYAAVPSELRLPGGASGSGISIPRPGLPSPRIRSATVAAEEGVEIGITRGTTTREVGEFLSEGADRQKSFIRTEGGGPTPEQEVIAPPGARFEGTGEIFGLRVGGRSVGPFDFGGEVVTGRVFRRGAAEAVEEAPTSIELADDTTRALTRASRAAERPSPTGTPFGTIGGTTTAPATNATNITRSTTPQMTQSVGGKSMAETFGVESGGPSISDRFGGITPTAPTGGTEPTPPSRGPNDITSIFGGARSTPSGAPTTGPTGPSSTIPKSPPTSPTGSPPSSPVTSPPSSPGGFETSPPSGPPLIPGTSPGGPTQQLRRSDRDTDDDEEPILMAAPVDQPFQNPILSAGEAVFGDFRGLTQEADEETGAIMKIFGGQA